MTPPQMGGIRPIPDTCARTDLRFRAEDRTGGTLVFDLIASGSSGGADADSASKTDNAARCDAVLKDDCRPQAERDSPIRWSVEFDADFNNHQLVARKCQMERRFQPIFGSSASGGIELFLGTATANSNVNGNTLQYVWQPDG